MQSGPGKDRLPGQSQGIFEGERCQVIPHSAYISFLIRIWRERDEKSGGAAAGWYSDVELIQSGKHWFFSSADDLLQFLHKHIENTDSLSQDPLDEGRA